VTSDIDPEDLKLIAQLRNERIERRQVETDWVQEQHARSMTVDLVMQEQGVS